MCGFAGVVKLTEHPTKYSTESCLNQMGAQIAHRGPDEKKIYQDGPLGMTFQRLAIVGQKDGSQPLENEDRSIVLMVNGEIYNHVELRSKLKSSHRFRGNSDCEVILHLYEDYGLECLSHLNGMFSMVLWDKRQQRLMLVRDRLGIKPLYFYKSSEKLLFASEIKSLLAHPDCPRQYDWETALGFSLGVPLPQPPSFFKGIDNLSPGTVLTIDLREKSQTTHAYWTPPAPSLEEWNADQRTEQEIIAGYKDLLADSVKIRLMSEAEVGLFLSGGIDSVSVARFAEPYRHIHTFSALSQSTLRNGDAKAACQAARNIGLPNHQVLFMWQDNPFTPDHWKQLLWLCETHFCGAEQLYKFHLHRFAKHLRPELKVMLLGQGSDEFNGGYGAELLKKAYPGLSPQEATWPILMDHMRGQEKGLHILRKNPLFQQYKDLLSLEFLSSLNQESPYSHPWHCYRETHKYTMQCYQLWHEDRTAAGNHIENRVPFLDHRLVEFTYRVPPQHYESLFSDKRILREALASEIPEDLRQRPKGPFFYGEDVRYTHRMLFDLLMGDDQALVREAFEPVPGSPPIFEQQNIDLLIGQIARDPEYGGTEMLLQLTNMGLLDKMARSLPSPPAEAESVPILSEININDWNGQEEELSLHLGTQRPHLDLDVPVAFAPQTSLLKSDGASDPVPRAYLWVDGMIEFELSGEEVQEWLSVLRLIDGKCSINEILQKLELPVASIRKHLEEAVDFGVLTFNTEPLS